MGMTAKLPLAGVEIEASIDPLWIQVRSEAADILASDGDLGSFVRQNVIDQPSSPALLRVLITRTCRATGFMKSFHRLPPQTQPLVRVSAPI